MGRWPTAHPTTTRKTPTLTDRLHALADKLGVQVAWHPGGPKGLWVPAIRTITLRDNMGWRKLRSTFAHELGHAIHDDRPTHDPWIHARQERRADEWAAQFLITPEDYAAAEQLHGPHDGALALELGVTTHIIRVCRSLHERATTP